MLGLKLLSGLKMAWISLGFLLPYTDDKKASQDINKFYGRLGASIMIMDIRECKQVNSECSSIFIFFSNSFIFYFFLSTEKIVSLKRKI